MLLPPPVAMVIMVAASEARLPGMGPTPGASDRRRSPLGWPFFFPFVKLLLGLLPAAHPGRWPCPPAGADEEEG